MSRPPLRLLPLLLTLIQLLRHIHAQCLPTQLLTPDFCANIPGVANFSLPTYAGRWHQIYTSGTATRFSSNRCVTANYTALPDGSVAVLNCGYRRNDSRPQCVRASALRIQGKPPSNLALDFGQGFTGQYNVVATLGFASYGYFAAAVFSCRGATAQSGPSAGFFILARTPFKPQYVLRLIKGKLRCLGLPLDDPFVRTRHPPRCVYFDGPNGFDVIPPFLSPSTVSN